jgi:hypothetical protein
VKSLELGGKSCHAHDLVRVVDLVEAEGKGEGGEETHHRIVDGLALEELLNLATCSLERLSGRTRLHGKQDGHAQGW